MDKKLLNWYKKNSRDLPWRRSQDPYYIWLSEIMLQQTQVITVIDYYKRFVERFKTVTDLALAEELEVLKYWEGLGYYSRARNLHKCAKEIVSRYGGHFPTKYQDLLALPGIGPYTAGAIASIAFNEKVPAVDGNVMRVYSRVFCLDCDISDPKSRLVFEKKVMETMPDDARHFNQAIMELGAMICTPKTPKCTLCPLKKECKANRLGSQLLYPIKSKKPVKKHEQVFVFIFCFNGKIMIEKRNEALLLKGLWGFPTHHIDLPAKSVLDSDFMAPTILESVSADYDLKGSIRWLKPVKNHVFTHLVWHMTLVLVDVESLNEIDYPEVNWIKPSDLVVYPLPTAFKKNISEALMAELEK